MLAELLATSNYVSYNIQLANMVGVDAAIYVSELMNILDKAYRKKKYDMIDNKIFFTIDRKYLESRIFMNADQQRDLESHLAELNFIEKYPLQLELGESNFGPTQKKNALHLNVEGINGLLGCQDNSVIDKIVKIKEKRKKKSDKELERENRIKGLCSKIHADYYTEEVVELWKSWIESCLDKMNGFMHPEAVVSAERILYNYSNGNMNVIKEVLIKAITGGWQDINFAIVRFEELENKHSKIYKSAASTNNVPEENIKEFKDMEIF